MLWILGTCPELLCKEIGKSVDKLYTLLRPFVMLIGSNNFVHVSLVVLNLDFELSRVWPLFVKSIASTT